MIVVRYITLVALVLWLGAMVGARFAGAVGRGDLVAAGCGVLILVGLFVMKFMGPPPHAFVPRVAIVALMLALALVSPLPVARDLSPMLSAVTLGLGFVLLVWYVRE